MIKNNYKSGKKDVQTKNTKNIKKFKKSVDFEKLIC